jgi:farnesyl diphosphate synthase
MSFAQRLESFAANFERRLQTLLSGPLLSGCPTVLGDAMRYACLGGGKRFRPYLVARCAALFDVTADRTFATAAAVECLHCYSLVHDDLPAMDDDDLRRGRPTVHRAFDEATAILAGDALLTLAFEILLQPDTHPDPAIRAELALRLARSTGPRGMAGGQQLDLAAEANPPGATTVADIEQIQALKTGALITYCCEAGAILGAANPAQRAALTRYGTALGLAFQISDDLLDAEGDATAMGKAARKDAAAGKATFVSLLGAEAARKRLDAVQQDAIAAISGFGAVADPLRDAVHFMSDRRS